MRQQQQVRRAYSCWQLSCIWRAAAAARLVCTVNHHLCVGATACMEML